MTSAAVGSQKWHGRLIRSGYFVGAVLLHLILFLLLATCIVFRPPAKDDSATFTRVAIPPPPPPPPSPPASSGGQVANPLEPVVEMTPPPTAPSIVSSMSSSAFTVATEKPALPNLPASLTAPVGTGLSGANAPGPAVGAGSSPFGSESNSGSAQLQGFLYDLKQTSDRKPTGVNSSAYHTKLKQFVKAHWDPALLSPYYKSPKPLNTSSIFIPTLSADDGPKAFGVENEVKPNAYVIWYKATATPGQEGTYHFVGVADDILVVRVKGQTVLDGSLFPVDEELRKNETKYDTVNFRASCPSDKALYVGTPFHVSLGDSLDIEVLIGEEPGGYSNYFLYIQRDESSYSKQSNGTPLLPVFQLDSNPIHPTGKAGSFPPFAATSEPWGAAQK